MTLMIAPNIPYARLRSKTGNRPLDPAIPAMALLPSSEARHDKLTVMAKGRVYLALEDVEAVLGSADDRGGAGGSGIVLCDGGVGAWQWKLKTPSARWLFGMQGKARYVSQAGRLEIEMELLLNPSRFLAHQPDPSLAAVRSRDPLDALWRDPVRRAEIEGQTLDGRDNAIIGRSYFPSFAGREPWWREVLEAYFNHVKAALTDVLTPVGVDGRFDYLEFTHVRSAEVQWELDHAAAVSWVNALSNRVLHADAAASIGRYLTVSGSGNAKVLRLAVRQDIFIKIYAKMFGRVRIELEYLDGPKINDIATDRGRFTRGSVIDTVCSLRSDAEGRLHAFWNSAMRLGNVAGEAASMQRLVFAVIRAAKGQNAERVLELLFAHHRLEQTELDGCAPQAVCEALTRDGILTRPRLRKRARAPQFALAPAYSRMITNELGSVQPKGSIH
ncbi:hypothetical protein [Methylobacterium bullatum]|uniref:Uncharacterized protein n=1 Tax=Methylobacterium bullatum TaxID=570505 RepID=A0A679K753_9HYPH|nr:hypothetical protein MBLL_03356 [Methylobacterium bullatum]